MWLFQTFFFFNREKINLSDSVDQDQTAQNVQSDLDLRCTEKDTRPDSAAWGLFLRVSGPKCWHFVSIKKKMLVLSFILIFLYEQIFFIDLYKWTSSC